MAPKVSKAKSPKKEKAPKEKRQASLYNVFMKNEIERLKKANPNQTAKDRFKLAALNCDLKRVYYLKEKRLAGLLCQVLGLEKTGRGARLHNWRVEEGHGRSQGDLSLVLHDIILQSEHCLQSALTINDINTHLDSLNGCKRISQGFTTFDVPKGTKVLAELYLKVTSREAKWLTRIILKELLLNIEPKVFFDAFHGWMWRIYSMQNDLEMSCREIVTLIGKGYHSAATLSEEEYHKVANEFFSPTVGVNIAVMACGRAQGIQHVFERMAGKTCYVENKYDGERLQAHLCKDWPERIRIFSKSGRESTSNRFRCSDWILRAFKFNDPLNSVYSVIAEGELLVFNERTGEIEAFGTVQNLQPGRTSAWSDILTGGRHYLVVFFDLLHLNGQNLTFKPLRERRRLLETIMNPIPNYIALTRISTVFFVKGSDEGQRQLRDLYSKALVDRMEGLIIKNEAAPYLPGNRSEWLKLKKDYIEGFGDTAEFAVVGLSYGKNGRGLLGTLVIGALTNKEELLADPATTPHFLLLFPVSQGFNAEEAELFHQIASRIVVAPSAIGHDRLTWAFAAGFRHDLDFIATAPIVVELLGSGFVKERGQKHHVLRFPRIRRVFFDRPYMDTVSFQELQSMAATSFAPGDSQERGELGARLEAHSKRQLELGTRAPKLERPVRVSILIPDPQQAGTLKNLARAGNAVPALSDFERLRTEYFLHAPEVFPHRSEIADRLESVGVETLYHMVAVVKCRVRKCIIIMPDDEEEYRRVLEQFRSLTKDTRLDVWATDLAAFNKLISNSEQFSLREDVWKIEL